MTLFETWGHIDRSHRKLAHRGSRIGLVHVSESTERRVLADEGLVLPGPPPREPIPRPGWPQWLEWKPNRIWAYDLEQLILEPADGWNNSTVIRHVAAKVCHRRGIAR